MTFIWVSQSDGSSSGTVFTVCRDSSRSSKETVNKNPTKFRNKTFLNLNTASWYIRQKERMSSHVCPCWSLWSTQASVHLHCLVHSKWCVFTEARTHTAQKERNIKTTVYERNLSDWFMCKCVTVFLIFINAVCLHVCFPQVARLPLLALSPKEVHSPVWWECSTTRRHTDRSSTHSSAAAMSYLLVEITVRQMLLSRCSAIFLDWEEEKERKCDEEKCVNINQSCICTPTYLLRPHRHASHHHWIHAHLPSHLAHVTSSSAGWHAPVHYHAPILAWIPLLRKLLLPWRSLLPKLLLRVRTSERENSVQLCTLIKRKTQAWSALFVAQTCCVPFPLATSLSYLHPGTWDRLVGAVAS